MHRYNLFGTPAKSRGFQMSTGSTSQLFCRVVMCFLAYVLRKLGFELFTVQIRGFTRLLQAFLNSDSNAHGHTDHGVVACAQEAHHFHVKSACRRLFACGAGTFGAGSPTFRKTRSTSPESGMLCFPSRGLSYHITCSRNKTFELS